MPGMDVTAKQAPQSLRHEEKEGKRRQQNEKRQMDTESAVDPFKCFGMGHPERHRLDRDNHRQPAGQADEPTPICAI